MLGGDRWRYPERLRDTGKEVYTTVSGKCLLVWSFFPEGIHSVSDTFRKYLEIMFPDSLLWL